MTARLFLTPHYAVGNGDTSVGLTPFEGRLLTAMAFSGEVTRDEAAEILWPNPDDMPDMWHNALWCVMSRLRAKIRPFGLHIESRYGFGWKLERHERSGPAQETPRKAA